MNLPRIISILLAIFAIGGIQPSATTYAQTQLTQPKIKKDIRLIRQRQQSDRPKIPVLINDYILCAYTFGEMTIKFPPNGVPANVFIKNTLTGEIIIDTPLSKSPLAVDLYVGEYYMRVALHNGTIYSGQFTLEE